MTSINLMMQNLFTGNPLRLTNKKNNIERVVNAFTMVDPHYINHPDYQDGIELSNQAHFLYIQGDYAEAARTYRQALGLLKRYQKSTGNTIPIVIPKSQKVQRALMGALGAAGALPSAGGATRRARRKHRKQRKQTRKH
jgi:hypothetical protein